MTPQWFSQGTVIDITSPTWDAAEFLEGDEFDYEWRLCAVPREALSALLKPTYDEFLVACPDPIEQTVVRCGEIMSWMAKRGGISKALTESPPVLLWTKAGPRVLDGWHRLGIAYHLCEAKQQQPIAFIPCLIGLGEPVE